MRPINKEISSPTNLGIFMSLKALIKTLSSYIVGDPLFKAPAITSTDFNALNPKS
jgi:hypothetical protein